MDAHHSSLNMIAHLASRVWKLMRTGHTHVGVGDDIRVVIDPIAVEIASFA